MPVPTETMPSLRADIAETLQELAHKRWIIPGLSDGASLWLGAETLRWVDARERAFDETECADLAEQLEAMELEHDAEHEEWDAKRKELESIIARLREDLAEALAD